MYVYNFPAIKLDTTDSEQVNKIEGELFEFRVAADIYGFDEDENAKLDPLNVSACIELWDVIHACETIMRRFDQNIVGACAHIVEAKNRARGYYDKPSAFELAARGVTADEYANGRC